ncbi:hypothetical protein YC2023_080066 [Brassica napus]
MVLFTWVNIAYTQVIEDVSWNQKTGFDSMVIDSQSECEWNHILRHVQELTNSKNKERSVLHIIFLSMALTKSLRTTRNLQLIRENKTNDYERKIQTMYN